MRTANPGRPGRPCVPVSRRPCRPVTGKRYVGLRAVWQTPARAELSRRVSGWCVQVLTYAVPRPRSAITSSRVARLRAPLAHSRDGPTPSGGRPSVCKLHAMTQRAWSRTLALPHAALPEDPPEIDPPDAWATLDVDGTKGRLVALDDSERAIVALTPALHTGHRSFYRVEALSKRQNERPAVPAELRLRVLRCHRPKNQCVSIVPLLPGTRGPAPVPEHASTRLAARTQLGLRGTATYLSSSSDGGNAGPKSMFGAHVGMGAGLVMMVSTTGPFALLPRHLEGTYIGPTKGSEYSNRIVCSR